MRKIKPFFIGFLVTLTGLWLLSDQSLFKPPFSFLPMRNVLMNYTGIIAIGMMSISMLLAVRPARFEPFFGGLDKMYRLHKWLGITGLAFSIMHWAIKESPGWLSGLGLIALPNRPKGPPAGGQAASGSSIEQFFQSLKHPAESVGEWAFYIAVVLLALALIKKFPYRYFFQTHRLMPLVYLALVFHSTFTMNFSYYSQVVGPFMAVLMAAGTVAAIIILFRKVGAQRKVVGVIESIERYAESSVVRVNIKVKDRWAGHEAGQFAFVNFDDKEAPHPFTISSGWKGDGHLFFLIKELGDYTKTLANQLKTGQAVTLEGPYGQFTFKSDKPRQIWVAGGIGITPFIARMHALAAEPTQQKVDLFFCVPHVDEPGFAKARADAQAAGINLHILAEPLDGRLDADRLCAAVPDWQTGDVWFCGPAGFGDSLSAALIEKGLPPEDFHRELFEMR